MLQMWTFAVMYAMLPISDEGGVMVLIPVRCLYWQSDQVTKRGKTETAKQRSRCHNPDGAHPSFLLDPAAHNPGKHNTQKIERKHLTLRTRIKRLVRKTMCFSQSIELHDIVIGLFVNRYEFGLSV